MDDPMRPTDHPALLFFTIAFGVTTAAMGLLAGLALMAASIPWFAVSLLLQLVAMLFTLLGLYALYGLDRRGRGARPVQAD